MSSGAISAWSLTWAESLWRASWQGAIFILLVWALCRRFPRLPAALCGWLWWLACLKLLLGLAPPLGWALSLPGQHPRAAAIRSAPVVLPRLETTAAADAITGLRSTWYADSSSATPQREPPSHSRSALPAARSRGTFAHAVVPPHETPISDRQTRSNCALLLLAVWIAGIGMRLLALGRQWRLLGRLVREARPLADPALREECLRIAAALRLRRLPALRESAAAPGPVVVGLCHPTILLPARVAAALSARERQMVLAHELAHLRRHDLGMTLVPGLAQMLFFFHPLAGLAAREWGAAREAACDAAALDTTGAPPAAYGRLLLKLVTPPCGAALPALGASCGYRAMQRRIRRLRQFPGPSHRGARAALALLFALGALGVLPLRLAARPADSPAPFAIDRVKALAQPVTLAETKIPLGDLLRELSAETGVTLSAAPDVADEPVAVVVKQFPAGRLLQELASLLDYRWHTTRTGVRNGGDRSERPDARVPRSAAVPPAPSAPAYEIWQDLASRHREEALRQALRGEAEKRFRGKVDQFVAMADQPPERIRQIAAALEKDPAIRDLPVGSVQRSQWEERSGLASRVAMPIPRALAQLLGHLTAAQWDLLQTDQPIFFSTDPAPGEASLPEAIARTFRGARPNWLPPAQKPTLGHVPDAERLIAMMRQAETETQSRWAAATGFRVVLRLTGSQREPGGFMSLNARAEPLQGGEPDPIPHPIGTDLMLTVGVGDALIQREPDTPERQAALARDPVVGRARPFRTERKRQALAPPDHDGAWTMRRDRAWGRWGQLPELARTYGVNFIADAYWTAGVQSAYQVVLPSSSAPVPLYRLLDALVSGTHHWDRHGDLIRLRSRTWFLDRPREIPLRLIRRWNGLLEAQGALPLEEDVRIVTALLDDDQLDTLTLLAFDGVLEASQPAFDAVVREKEALRLYSALWPSQRQALWRGAPLSAASLTPVQRALLLAALSSDDSSKTPLSGAALAAARFSLTRQPVEIVVEQRPDRITYRVEELPAVSPEGLAAPQSLILPAGSPAAAPAGKEVVRRHLAMRITFHYQFGAQHLDLPPLTVANPEPP